MTFSTILKAILLFDATAQALAISAFSSTAEFISQIHDKIETFEATLDKTDFPYLDVDVDERSPLASRELDNDILDFFNLSDAFDENQEEFNEPLSKRGWRKWWREFWEAKLYQ